jgi:predicted CoA-binding protein
MGDMKVFSKPGQTIFRIMLPEDPEDQEESMIPMPSAEATNDELAKKILETAHNIAVVGISSRPERPAHSVPAYLQANGYRIIPVNPNVDEVLGEKAYPDLLSIPENVDVVEIFRPSEEVESIVEQAIEIGAKAVWMQEGIVNERAYEMARQAGLDAIMDICMRATHQRLFK